MSWFAILRMVHIGLGALALVVLPVPLVTRKGSKLHVSFGRVYAFAMGAVAVTGMPLAARGLFFDDPARRANALYLFYIAVLASDNAWMGIRALRASKSGASRRTLVDLGPPTLLLASAIGIFALGLARGTPLYLVFASLGIVVAVSQIAFCLRESRTRADAIVRHIAGMGISSITTLTAFLITNAQHLFGLRAFTFVVWVTPALLGGLAIAKAQRTWRARLAGQAARE